MDISQLNSEHQDIIMIGFGLLIFIVAFVIILAMGSSSTEKSNNSNIASEISGFQKTTHMVQFAGHQLLTGKQVSDIEVIPYPQSKASQVAQMITIKFTDGTILKIDGITMGKLEAAVRWNIIQATQNPPLKL